MDVDAVNLGVLVLRVAAGVTLALHGLNKFKGGLGGVGQWFESMGMKPGRLHATMAASTETFGGLALALGLLTPLAAMAIVGTMTVAGWVDHRKAFFIFKGGFEFVLSLAAIAVGVATTGAGEWSLDNAIGFDFDGVPALVLSGVGGLVAGAAFLAVFYRPVAQPAS